MYVQKGLIPYVRIELMIRFIRGEILDWIAQRVFIREVQTETDNDQQFVCTGVCKTPESTQRGQSFHHAQRLSPNRQRGEYVLSYADASRSLQFIACTSLRVSLISLFHANSGA